MTSFLPDTHSEPLLKVLRRTLQHFLRQSIAHASFLISKDRLQGAVRCHAYNIIHRVWYTTSTLLKPLNNPNLLIPYEQYYIQTLYWEGKLIPEQSPGEINPLFQTVINPQPPHTTWIEQLCFSLQHNHHSKPATPNLQHTTNWGMYNLKFT